jgi:hypothetical protein
MIDFYGRKPNKRVTSGISNNQTQHSHHQYQPETSLTEEVQNAIPMDNLVEKQTKKRMDQLTKSIKAIEKMTPDILI